MSTVIRSDQGCFQYLRDPGETYGHTPVSGGLGGVLRRGMKRELDEENHAQMVARLMAEPPSGDA